MSGSFHQLYLLLWRNLLIRWRGGHVTILKKVTIPLFQLVEVLWPLLLYLIIVGLRQHFPPEKISDSKYRGFALPSAGMLPFLQTMLCDIDSKKDHYPFSDMPVFPNAKINNFYGVLDDVGEWNATWTKLCDTLHDLAEQGNCISDTSTKACSTASQDEVPLTCYLKNSTEFEQYLSRNLSLSKPVVNGILGATLNLSEVSSFPQFLGGGGGGGRRKRQIDNSIPFLLQNFGSLKPLVCKGPYQWSRLIQFSNISEASVKKELCHLNDSEWQDLSQEIQQQVASECNPVEVSQRISQVLDLQQLLQKTDLADMFDGLPDSGWNNDTSNEEDEEGDEECQNSLDNYIHYFCGSVRTRPSEALHSILGKVCYGDSYKQANRGNINDGSDLLNANNATHQNNVTLDPSNQISLKILYTPHSNITQSIIQKANRTFETAGQMMALAEQVSKCSQFFLDNFPPDSLEGERKILEQLITYKETGVVGNPTVLDITPLFPNVSLDDLQTAQDLLNSSAPNNIWTIMMTAHNVSENILTALRQFDWDVFYPVGSEGAMEELAGNYTQQDEYGITYIVAGIVFESNLTGSSLKNSVLKIRTNFSAVVDPSEYKETIWYPGPENDFWKKRYISAFFIFVQDMIERGMMEEIVGHRISSPGVYIQEMPYPCYKEDKFTISLLYVLPLAMLFAWLFPVAMTARAVVKEKEVRMKEFMKMMGVSEGILRLSWFIHSFGVLLVSVVCITILLKVGGVLPATDWLILFIYLTLYAIVMLSYSFLVSVFFNNANLAACVASLIYFLVFFAHVTIVPNMSSLSPVVIGICCLWAPLAFALGATYLVQWELQQEGLQWRNIAIPPIEDDHLSFLSLIFIMTLDAIIYFVVAWYIEGVYPGRYGVAKPWYFPFMPSYWCGQWSIPIRSRRGGHVTLEEDGEEMIGLRGSTEKEEQLENCEEDPQGLTLGISIQNLTKKFSTGFLPGRKKNVLAVKDLSLNFYESQISAFLGHNGAGKTTTMSILTGLFEPSSGTAYIYGNSIRRHMDTIRQNLGICPQHNILFDELTVEEHLLFYGQLKGLTRREAKQQVPLWLDKVDLLSHAHKYSKNLSGGMKRKLSILLAFVGKSKTIILDEPTSGVDPFARRQIWDFLLRHRENRTIMLSTHHMDEAEILGDRIAIISSGSLLCCGSFEYLMHRFGRGHRLTLVSKMLSDRRASISSRTFTVTADMEDEVGHSSTSSADIALVGQESSLQSEMEITKFLQGIIVGATLIERRGRELHYLLPLLQSRPHNLARLFSDLEKSKDVLGVTSYGMTSCSMEEIFVQLTEQELMDKTEANTVDSFAPRPTLPSVDSQTSLDPPAAGAEQSGVREDEEDLLDEDGLLFGDQSCDDPLGSGAMGTNNRLTHVHLWIVQFYALLIKRVLYTRGTVVALTVQNLFPLVVIILSLFIARILQSVPDPPELELSPHLFFAKSRYNYMFAGGYYTNETSPMVNSLFHPCGVAAHSVGYSTEEASKCYHSDTTQCPVSNYPQVQYSCTCLSCEDQSSDNISSFSRSSGVPSCYNGTYSGSRVLNVTLDYDPADPESGFYYLHNYLLRSTSSFIEERYGGLSFGHSKQEVDAQVDDLNSDPSSTLPFLATRSAAKVWYSLKGYHAMPAYLNAMNNAILRSNLVNVSQDALWEYGILTKSHPFQVTHLEKLLYAVKENASFLVNPLAAIFSLGFVVAGFVLLLIEERSCNIKHLQLVCGMNKVVYWISAYFWDLLWYTCFIILMIILYIAFKDPYYTACPEDMAVFFILLFCYGVSCGPWMYIGSFFFRSPATAYVFLFCLNFFSGFSLLIIDAIVVQLQDRSGTSFLHYDLIWVPFPSYAMARSMMYFSLDRPFELVASTLTSDPLPNAFSKLSPFMLTMCVQGCVYTCVIILIEAFPLITSKIIQCRSLSLPPPTDEDEAVANERRRVLKADASKELLVLRNLTKIYGTKLSSQYRLAVNQLCLKMKKAECFGLLGVNGAGKTTTFRMLTGDTRVTSGEAHINSLGVSSGGVKGGVSCSVGYCPQVDALMTQLTGRQQLTFYSRLRGLTSTDTKKVVEWAIVKLGLSEYADKPAGTYSGGNRRKLSTAIALLARPPLILLDEPTSGVDPRARQFLWKIVKDAVSAGQSVLLTTHSMAECEALCSRVGIMVNGSFCCLGSPQQLKIAYGEGYRLKIRVTTQIKELKDFISQNISHASLKEEHCGTLIYQLPSVGLNLPAIYETMEVAREALDIKDYSLSQTSLDDVFIHFANKQSEDAGLQHQEPSLLEQEQDNLQLPDIIAGIESHT